MQNINLRQSPVKFEALTHTYWLDGKQLKGVTNDELEAVRNAQLLSEDGVAVVNDMYLVPVTVSSGQQPDVKDLDERVKAIKNLRLIDAMKIATEDVGNPRTMNMVVAGALSKL